MGQRGRGGASYRVARRCRRVLAPAAVLALVPASLAVLGAGAAAASPTSAVVVSLAVRSRVPTPAVVPRGARPLGRLPASTRLRVEVVLRPRDPAALAAAVVAVSTPTSRLYHHYLRRGQFGPLFGASPATIAAVRAVLAAEGLGEISVSSDDLAVSARGPAAAVERAFGVSIERYRLPTGRVVFAPEGAATFPRALGGSVADVLGLDDLPMARPAGLLWHQLGAAVRAGRDAARRGASGTGSATRAGGAVAPRFLPASSGPQPCNAALPRGAEQASGPYTANQLAAAYDLDALYGAGDLGQGVTVALYELEPYTPSDITAYESCYGISTTVTPVAIDGGAGTTTQSGEAALDIEDVAGLAPDVTIDVYTGPNSGTGPYDTYKAIVDQDVAKVVSTSWGLCEPLLGASYAEQSEAPLFEQAALQGQTVLAAAGDDGSTDCDGQSSNPATESALAVDDPASQPDVTGVGGTTLELTSASGGRSSETVWNDSSKTLGAGGGGVSAFWRMPAYQSGAPAWLGVEGNDSSGEPCAAPAGSYCRQVPDVSADADPLTGYVIYWQGSWTDFGGTSAATPLWASVVALADASSECAPAGSLGLLNPDLYSLAGSSAKEYAAAFYDVTSGNDDYTPSGYTGGLYPATPGYDMASGLGTPDAGALVPGLCGPTVASVTPSSGPAVGGATVTVSGTRFATGSGETTVDFGSMAATAVSCASSTSCTVRVPPGAGTVEVSVTVGGVTSPSSPAGLFAYVPVVTSLSPSSGPQSGGTTVTVSGAGFLTTSGGTTIDFGSTPASSVSCTSETTCTAVSPPGSAGTSVPVTATVAGETSPSSGAPTFTYLSGAPTVSSLAPTSGPATGGTTVTIDGTNLSGASVSFGPTASSSVSCSATSCTALSPPGAGTVTVTVSTPSGSASAGLFAYVPVVTSLSPSSGPQSGGTTVTVSGAGFLTTSGGTTIDFGSTPASSVSCTSETTCTAVSPPGYGTVGVTVTVDGTASAPDAGAQFLYEPGYYLVGASGQVSAFGGVPVLGSVPPSELSAPVVGMALDRATHGYWIAEADGAVVGVDAPVYGDLLGTRLHAPVVGLAATPDGGGYWLVAADGGVFAFGDAPFLGSVPGALAAECVAHGFSPGCPEYRLAAPVVGLAATPDGGGYWLVAADGGVFAFGDAPFLGSLGGQAVPAPVVSIAYSP